MADVSHHLAQFLIDGPMLQLSKVTPLMVALPETCQRILVVPPPDVGDAIESLALIGSLARRFPHAEIAVQCGAGLVPIYECDERVCEIQDEPWIHLQRSQSKETIAGRIEILAEHVGRFNLAFNLDDSLGMSMWMSCLHIDRLFGLRSSGTGEAELCGNIHWFRAQALASPVLRAHLRAADLVQWNTLRPAALWAMTLGLAEAHTPDLFVAAIDQENVEAAWTQFDIGPQEKVVAVYSQNDHKAKALPIELAAQLLRCIERDGFRALLIHGPGEEAYANSILQFLSHHQNQRLIVADPSARELAVLGSKLALLITTAAPPGPLVAMGGGRVLTVAGPTMGIPYQAAPHVTIQSPEDCSECLKAGHCQNAHPCMQRIPASDIWRVGRWLMEWDPGTEFLLDPQVESQIKSQFACWTAGGDPLDLWTTYRGIGSTRIPFELDQAQDAIFRHLLSSWNSPHPYPGQRLLQYLERSFQPADWRAAFLDLLYQLESDELPLLRFDLISAAYSFYGCDGFLEGPTLHEALVTQLQRWIQECFDGP